MAAHRLELTLSGPITPKDLFTRLAEAVSTLQEPLTHRWAFGEQEIAVQIWGAQESPYVGALEPGTDPVCEPVYTIDVICSKGTAVPWPGIHFAREDFGRNRRLDGWSNDCFESYALRPEKGLAVADKISRRAIVWLPSLDKVDPHERAAPFRWLAESIAGSLGQGVLHCAAIGQADRAVLITGRGGIGKSTLALTALGAGWSYFGDDYVLVASEPEPRCFRLYRSAKWVTNGLALPEWISRDDGISVDPKNRKRMIFLDQQSPALAKRESAVTMLLRPRIDPALTRPEIAPANPRKLVMDAVISTVAQSDAAHAPIFAPLSDMARRLPCREIGLSPDLSANLQLLGDNLDEAA